MTPEVIAAIEALQKVTFLPGSKAKRFVRDMTTRTREYALSAKQEAYLKRLVWMFRKQIKRYMPGFDFTWALSDPEVQQVAQGIRHSGPQHEALVERYGYGYDAENIADWWTK